MDTRSGIISTSVEVEKLPKDEQSFFREMQVAPTSRQQRRLKVGRNDPCPCGSGIKFKKCCLGQEWRDRQKRIDDALKESREIFERAQARLQEETGLKRTPVIRSPIEEIAELEAEDVLQTTPEGEELLGKLVGERTPVTLDEGESDE